MWCTANISAEISQSQQKSPLSLSPFLTTLSVIGFVLLVIWLIRRNTHRQKLTLQNTPGRANHLHPLMMLLVFFGPIIIGATLLWLCKNVDIPYKIAGLHIFSQVFMIVAAIFLAKYTFRNGVRRGMGFSLRRPVFDSLRGLWGYFAILPVCILLVIVTTPLLEVIQEQIRQRPGMEEFKLINPHASLVAWKTADITKRFLIAFSAIIMAPLAEELFFRGLLQSYLRKLLSPWWSILIASLLFVMAHAQPQNMPSLFVLALVLGYNYERCGRLWPSILIHMLFNATFIIETACYAG